MTEAQPLPIHDELISKIYSGTKTTVRIPVKKQPFVRDPLHRSVDSPSEHFKYWTWWGGSYTQSIYHDAYFPYGDVGSSFTFENIETPMIIKAIRVEELHEMTEDDAIAEGCVAISCDHARQSCEDINCCGPTALGQFKAIWNLTHTTETHTWNDNPWVWVIEFEKAD